MQPVIGTDRKTLRKAESEIISPTKQPTYIVTLAVNENVTTSNTENSITNKTSVISITSSVSTRTLTLKHSTQNTFAVLDSHDSDAIIKEERCDGRKEASNTLNEILTYLKINEVNSQPQVIFIAQKHTRKSKFDAKINRRKSKKHKKVVIIKNIHFKNQRARNMTSKLKGYGNKTKKLFYKSREINRELEASSISKKVSRTRVLKKVLGKENFLAETEIIHDSVMSSSYLSDSSFLSIASYDSSTREDEDSPDSINSIIEVRNTKVSTYETNIINVAVAQINNTPNLNRTSYSIIVPHRERADFKDSLTSYESAFSQTSMLTSKSILEDTMESCSKNTILGASSSNNNVSNETLIPPQIRPEISDDNFQTDNRLLPLRINNNVLSNCTLKCSLANETQDYRSLNDNISDIREKDTRTFYDACMTFNVCTKSTPCTSSVPDLSNNGNVIITEDILKATQQIEKLKNRGDERIGSNKTNFYGNIFQKPFNEVSAVDFQKHLNLPNAAEIKNTMVNTSRQPKKCSQEVDSRPMNYPELCEKLTIVLEIALKKIEQTLSENIVNELKRSLYEFDKHIHSLTKFQEDTTEYMTKERKLERLTKSKEDLQTILQSDACLQCDIVPNEVIHKLMLAFTEEYSKSLIQSSSSNITHKLKEPKFVKDYFEILRNPLSSQYKEQEIGKGDSFQISIEDAVEEQIPKFAWKKTFWNIPVTILRENMFVVASVPAFLFVMFVIYSYIMLIIRMWWY